MPSEPGADEQEVVKQEESIGLEDRTTATDSGMVSGQSVSRVTPTATGSERATSSAPSTTAELKVETIDPWYETFNPRSDWLPNETKEEDYTEEGYRNLERKFWRELGLGEACWYGADMKGSLFTDETTSWNVAHLPNLLNRLNLKRKLPGVNTPYLYWGMWAAAFAWHVEDVSSELRRLELGIADQVAPGHYRWTSTRSTIYTSELPNSGTLSRKRKPMLSNDIWRVRHDSYPASSPSH